MLRTFFAVSHKLMSLLLREANPLLHLVKYRV